MEIEASSEVVARTPKPFWFVQYPNGSVPVVIFALQAEFTSLQAEPEFYGGLEQYTKANIQWKDISKADGSKVIQFTFGDCQTFDSQTMTNTESGLLSTYRLVWEVSAETGKILGITNLNEALQFHLRQVSGTAELEKLTDTEIGSQLKATLEKNIDDELRELWLSLFEGWFSDVPDLDDAKLVASFSDEHAGVKCLALENRWNSGALASELPEVRKTVDASIRVKEDAALEEGWKRKVGDALFGFTQSEMTIRALVERDGLRPHMSDATRTIAAEYVLLGEPHQVLEVTKRRRLFQWPDRDDLTTDAYIRQQHMIMVDTCSRELSAFANVYPPSDRTLDTISRCVFDLGDSGHDGVMDLKELGQLLEKVWDSEPSADFVLSVAKYMTKRTEVQNVRWSEFRRFIAENMNNTSAIVSVEDLFAVVQPSGWIRIQEPGDEPKKVFAMLVPQECAIAHSNSEIDESDLEAAERIDIEDWKPLQVSRLANRITIKTSEGDTIIEADDANDARRWVDSIDSTLIAYADEEFQGEVERLVTETVKSINASIKQLLVHKLYMSNY